MEFNRLPVEVLNNITSYKLGKPEYMKIKHKHNEELKRIQRIYKINRTETEMKSKIYTNIGGGKVNRQVCQYYISRKVPLSIESIEDIIITEGDRCMDRYARR